MGLEFFMFGVAEEDDEESVFIDLKDVFLLLFLFISFLSIFSLFSYILLNFLRKLFISSFVCILSFFFFILSGSFRTFWSFFSIFWSVGLFFWLFFSEKRLQFDAEKGEVTFTKVTVTRVNFLFNLPQILIQFHYVTAHI